MTLRLRPAVAALATVLITAFAMACDSATQAEVIQTTQAENRNANATATAQAGGGGGVTVGSGSLAERTQQTAVARATAEAAGGGAASPTAVPTQSTGVQMPDGPALTDADNPTVEMASNGEFIEAVIKVKVGTTVTWTTSRRTSISTTSFPGEAEQWDSGPISKPTFGDAPPFRHTFTIPGCHRYQSTQSTERFTAAVCVEE